MKCSIFSSKWSILHLKDGPFYTSKWSISRGKNGAIYPFHGFSWNPWKIDSKSIFRWISGAGGRGWGNTKSTPQIAQTLEIFSANPVCLSNPTPKTAPQNRGALEIPSAPRVGGAVFGVGLQRQTGLALRISSVCAIWGVLFVAPPATPPGFDESIGKWIL